MKTIKENLHWIAIILIALALCLLFFGVNIVWHIVAIWLLIAVGCIEAYLIWQKQATITNFYIPLLPKYIDWPMAIAVPVALVVKAVLIYAKGEIMTVWWVAGAIIISWIVAHLCSYERR